MKNKNEDSVVEKKQNQGRKQGRKVDSYLLLFLTRKECYGGELVTMCEELIPHNQFDSAMIYRTLKKLESEEAVVTEFREHEGKIIKFYRITEYGVDILREAKERVLSTIENLNFFLNKYEKWEG